MVYKKQKCKENFFAEQLRKVMFDKKITQQKLGEILGIQRPLISKWLTGKQNPSLSSIKKLAAALKVPFTYFVIDNQKNFDNSNNSGIIGNYNNVTNSKIELLEEKLKLKDEKIKILEDKIKFLEDKIKFLERKK